MTSQITHAQSPNINDLARTLAHLRPSYNLPQRHHVTASHFSPGDKPPERGREVRKNTELLLLLLF